MLDALIFSLAAYEPTPERSLAVLQSEYDLPIATLDLVQNPQFVQKGSQSLLIGRSSHGHIIAAFRGTADMADLVQDLKFLPRRVRFAQGAAHFGFVERAQSIDVAPFLELLRSGEKILFTGHSLGGAVAALVALRVLESAIQHGICCPHQRRVECVTFGAPLFANPDLAEIVNAKYHDLFCHVIAKHDCVPKILPLVALAQRVFGGGPHNHLEVLRLARAGLDVVEAVTHVPVASAIRHLELAIPPPVRSIAKWMVRLLWPGDDGDRYVFAGNVLVLDREAAQAAGAVQVSKSEDLNWWSSQLGFALGVNLRALGEHGLMSYYAGFVRCLSSQLKGGEPDAGSGVTAAAATAATTAGLAIGSSMAQAMAAEDGCEARDCKITVKVQTTVQQGGAGDLMEAGLERSISRSRSAVVRCGGSGRELLARATSGLASCSKCVAAVQVHTACEVTVEREGHPPRRHVFRFSWLLSTIGRVSRHLRSLPSLDRVCLAISVVRLAFWNPF